MPKRQNKTKEEIAQEMKMVQKAENRRKLVKEVLEPQLKLIDADVRYTKIFLHTASVAVDTKFNHMREDIKIRDMNLMAAFDPDGETTHEYRKLYEAMGDETIASFQAIVKELPDQLDNYMFKRSEKVPYSEINIDEILG